MIESRAQSISGNSRNGVLKILIINNNIINSSHINDRKRSST
jgi:hypothetical protein